MSASIKTINAGDLPNASKGDDPAKAAKSLEAYFLRQVLSEVRKSSSSSGQKSLFGGGFAGDTFKEMLDGALSDAMAGTAGIAKMLQPAMEKSAADPTSQKPDAKTTDMKLDHKNHVKSASSALGPVSTAHAQRVYSLATNKNLQKALKDSESLPNQSMEAPNAR